MISNLFHHSTQDTNHRSTEIWRNVNGVVVTFITTGKRNAKHSIRNAGNVAKKDILRKFASQKREPKRKEIKKTSRVPTDPGTQQERGNCK